MITKFFHKLLGKKAPRAEPAASQPAAAPRAVKPVKAPPHGQRHEWGPADHCIDPNLVEDRAVQVVHTLKRGGYEAYIVGGAVRDLLLGLRPKDFDVATNATPEQVKALFRRAFIIGRRFRIVHVVFGRGRQDRGLSEVIEVSTFRALVTAAEASPVSGNERTAKGDLAGLSHAVDESGRVLRDNVWGSQQDDAARRDFSINALYYDPESQLLVDYHGGLADVRKRTLRMIGDPASRYREDPVRIIRAVRFAAKLADVPFRFEAKTAKALVPSVPLLADVPPSRLFDEMLKLLQTGHGLASIAQLKALHIHGIYPLLDLVVERAEQPLVQAALRDTDRRVAEGKSVVPSFLLACVLWPDVRTGWQQRLALGQPPVAALQEAVDAVFDARIGDVSGRGRLGADMREIWLMQPRFDKRSGSSPFALLNQARFRAAFDFMRLRAGAGELPTELAAWWEAFSQTDPEQQERMLREQRQAKPGPQSRRVRSPQPAPGVDATADDGAQAEEEPAAAEGWGDSPKRRRRRRRGGAGRAGAQAGARGTEEAGDEGPPATP